MSCTTPNPAFRTTKKEKDAGGSGEGVTSAADARTADTRVCAPQCAGRECGSDGCGGLCGLCPPGTTCNGEGRCEKRCTPSCEDRQCGPDGCGGTCGTCTPPLACDEGTGECISTCTPGCVGKQCGPDGCGGSCGTCPDGKICDAKGQCVGSGDPCGLIDVIGCCDGTILKYCTNKKTLKVEDCSKAPKCGWDFKNKYYDCGTTGIADPTSVHPKKCP